MGEAAAALTRGTVTVQPHRGRCPMKGTGRKETHITEDTLRTRLATDRDGGHILVVDRVVVDRVVVDRVVMDRVVPAQLSHIVLGLLSQCRHSPLGRWQLSPGGLVVSTPTFGLLDQDLQ